MNSKASEIEFITFGNMHQNKFMLNVVAWRNNDA